MPSERRAIPGDRFVLRHCLHLPLLSHRPASRRSHSPRTGRPADRTRLAGHPYRAGRCTTRFFSSSSAVWLQTEHQTHLSPRTSARTTSSVPAALSQFGHSTSGSVVGMAPSNLPHRRLISALDLRRANVAGDVRDRLEIPLYGRRQTGRVGGSDATVMPHQASVGQAPCRRDHRVTMPSSGCDAVSIG